jgi:hypothetical protein
METPVKTSYEVVLWEDGGVEGANVATTIEDAARLCTDPRCYVIAVENWSHRRPLTEEEKLQLSRAKIALAQETKPWPPIGKSTWGVCGICGHDSVVTDPELVLNICLDCGARETAVGWMTRDLTNENPSVTTKLATYSIVEFDDGRCFPPMGLLTLEQAASLVTTTNYVVAIENGVTRALTKQEEQELRAYTIRRSLPAPVTKLVVGQEVHMSSGVYGNKGKVVKITPDGVEVEITERTLTHESLVSLQAGKIAAGDVQTTDAVRVLHFDTNGRSYVTKLPSSYNPSAHPASPWRWDGNGTYECGPWIIVDICPHVLDSDGYHCTRCWTMMIPWEAKS